MMLVETRVAPSPIHGLGLFAAQPIKARTVIWRMDRLMDLTFTDAIVAQLPKSAASFLHRYAYRCKHTGVWVLCGDDARFFNHVECSNTGEDYTVPCPFGIDVALRDIAKGEELTTNYEGFDGDWRQKLEL